MMAGLALSLFRRPATPAVAAPAPEVLVGEVARILERIEALPAEATGALIAGDPKQPTAAVLIELGRICWVVAPALQRRLTDSLRARANPPLTRAEMERLYVGCRTQGTPLGETLVAQGRLSSSALRAALKRHSAESLLNPALVSAELRWVPHRQKRGYCSLSTFRPGELLAEVGATLLEDERVEQAEAGLRGLPPLPAGAFLPDGRTLLACVEGADRSLLVKQWFAAVDWAGRALTRVAEPAGQVRYVPGSEGELWVTWAGDGLAFVGCCQTRSAFSALIAILHRRGFPAAAQSAEHC